MSNVVATEASSVRSLPRTPPIHLGYLDGLRAFAAILVIFHHGWLTIWSQSGLGSPLWTHWLFFGHIAVDLFIVLSGFCLMLPVVRGGGILRGGTLLFFKKRARRILPPYYFAMAFSLVLIFSLIGKPTGTHWDISLPVTPHSILIHLLLLQDFSSREIYTINHAFWSISLEWWIYFLFPALVVAWRRFGAGVTTTATFAFSYLLVFACLHKFHNSFTLQYIGLFALGMLGAEISQTQNARLKDLRDRLPWGLVTSAAVVAALLAIKGKIPHLEVVERFDGVAGIAIMCILVTMSLRPSSVLTRTLSARPIVFLGSFAYSIYLIHAPLLQVIWQYILHPLHFGTVQTFLLLVFLGTPPIVAVAYLFHLAFERPFMSKPGTKIKTEAQAEVAAVENPAP